MLTDQQIQVLTQGAQSSWAKQTVLTGQTLPPYISNSAADAGNGKKVFATFCAGCHGVDGTGAAIGKVHTGSLVDPAYLALISDQGLRSIIVSGRPEDGMPDWRSQGEGAASKAMTNQEISDVVAWLASHRVAAPGQPYSHP
jgi:cytochrome c oxidase cbb3-type subunit 3/ubiquinol-cytochrome c reductase cytochrome c subunit